MFPGAVTVYKLMYLVGFALMMVINLKTRKKYELKANITIIITLITYVAGVSGAMIMGDIFSALMKANGLPGASKVAIFGAVIFTPLFMSIASILLKQDWRKVLDMLAPGIYIILACAKFGCFLAGCCHGVECSFGIRYMDSDMTVFPIQIVEVFLMSLIIAFCFWFALKSKLYKKGAVYPVTTIIYCFVRFFIEFFRYYETEAQRHVVMGMTLWQFCSLAMIIVSVVWTAFLYSKKGDIYNEKVELKEQLLKQAYEEKKLKEKNQKLAERAKAKKSKAKRKR